MYYKHRLMTWIQRSLRVSTSEQMVNLQLAFLSRTFSPSRKASLESGPRWMLEGEEGANAARGDHEKPPPPPNSAAHSLFLIALGNSPACS